MSQLKFFQDQEADLVCPTFMRAISDDIYSSLFYCPKPETYEYQTNLNPIPQQECAISEQSHSIPQFCNYKTTKNTKSKEQKKQKKDYKKNICGYITKKIVRQFMSSVYKDKVMSLCQKYNCSYLECIDFYDKRIQRITGPTHLDMLLNSSKQAPKIKRCFKQFFIWFLRYRYLRYLIIEGKMERKDIYIDYKNKTLLYLGSMTEMTDEQIHENSCESKQTY